MAYGDPSHVARPSRSPRVLTPCERELEAKNAENTQLREELEAERERGRELEERVAELEQQLEVMKRPHSPIWPHSPIRPYGDMGPGGPGSGP